MESGTLKPETFFDLIHLFVYEAAGTFILMNAISLASGELAILIIPFALFVSIVLFGRITGGHFNGAVTLGIFIIEGNWAKNLKVMIVYFAGQLTGSYLALILSHFAKHG